MTQGIQNSLVNLGDLAKPADTLIKKISKAVGGVFAPYQITRVAKAEAEAALIKAGSAIQITDLHRRAMHRFVEEEAQRQQNIEGIAAKALPQLGAGAKPEAMEDDWVTNFFDKSRIVSDVDMQVLWARVLAGEANSPGRYSKRTVNFLSDLDKADAELFQNLCSFGWLVGAFTPLVFDPEAEIYNRRGVNFASLVHLDSIGLIQFDSLGGFIRKGIPKAFAAFYCGQPLLLTMEKDSGNHIEIGNALLTKVGQELAGICISPGVEGFVDYVKDKWKEHLPQASKPEPGAAKGGESPGVTSPSPPAS